ncbi:MULTISPECIES: hypothetical protein [Microbacterium]|uniref:Uncharacterized protein n=2 Tax=Microbacterium TaxID=33882 RepID=A0A3S9WQ79_9MICO|nr:MULTISPECIES: hypothetical protein [Microbacterium]AZS42158.1 hypothetical protein CVS54_03520 [Microbacterium oxydans]KKX97482.1 hypothetical protein AAY78_12850 [Microbacterium sp. Ag1]
MTDASGTQPEEPVIPEQTPSLEEPRSSEGLDLPDESLIPPADVVIPPPPPEIPIPDGLLTPPPSDLPSADTVIPPPPPATRRGDRARPTPAILEGEPPAAVADDWALPSVAPEVPTSGGYRVLTIVIFAFLFLLLVAAIVVGVYLLNTTSFPFAGADVAASSISGVPLL